MYKINEQRGFSSAELILSVDQIEVAEFYLECKVELDVNVCSPFRPDPQPGCRFTVDPKGFLTFFDCSRGISYTLIRIVSEKKNISYDEAKALIIRDFLLNTTREKKELRVLVPKEKRFDLTVAIRDFEQYDLNLWSIAPDIKVTRKDFQKYHTYALSFYSINDNVISPSTTAYLFNLGSTKQIYRPELPKKSDSFEGRYRSNTVKGLYGISFLKDDWYVIVTKSYRDWFYLQKLGINSLFVLSEGHIFSEEEKAILARYSVFILYDNDTTGIAKSFELKDFGYVPIFLPENDVVANIKVYNGEKTKKYLMKKINGYKKQTRAV